MINLFFSNGRAYVWNPDDVYILRKEHHIVGSLVGCYPTKPFQIHAKWLPQQLMPEETTLLLEKGIAKLIPSPLGVPEQSVVHSYYERKEKLCEEQ
ncbi:probable tRNA-splicing endonuclease subunit sen34, partial [Stegodyphus dumicola]|uniref:probable tRNA-splicing endonuclease subunit sen34 n=1 Tax=Stegodyphus dumicola TaxID=202533 RepID=UPI0015B0F1D5